MNTDIIFEVTRGPIVELRHRGAVAVTDTDGKVLWHHADPHLVTYLRSAAKPFQVLPLLEADGAERFELSAEEIAIMCGSHNAEPTHVEWVHRALAKLGLSEADLQCGPHYPLHEDTANEMRRKGQSPTAIHSNCSGKHAGMLGLAQVRGFSTQDYLDPSHPGQACIRRAIAELAEIPEPSVIASTDGCGAPVFALPLSGMARMFARLARPKTCEEPRRGALTQIAEAMVTHPHLIAGQGRLCTALMKAFPGEVVAKSGAAGVYGVGLLQHGLGIAVKVEDGDVTMRSAITLETLRQLNLLDAARLNQLWEEFCPPIKTCHGLTVREIRPAFRLIRP